MKFFIFFKKTKKQETRIKYLHEYLFFLNKNNQLIINSTRNI